MLRIRPTLHDMPAPPTPVLVSACLVGERCRYDGCAAKAGAQAALTAALRELGPHEVVAFCPEQAGGLATPRPAAWIEAEDAAAVLAGRDRLVTEAGDNGTAAFVAGAEAALELCRARGIERAYLKERSPSCGVRTTHVAGQPVPGRGVTAELLESKGIATRGF